MKQYLNSPVVITRYYDEHGKLVLVNHLGPYNQVNIVRDYVFIYDLLCRRGYRKDFERSKRKPWEKGHIEIDQFIAPKKVRCNIQNPKLN